MKVSTLFAMIWVTPSTVFSTKVKVFSSKSSKPNPSVNPPTPPTPTPPTPTPPTNPPECTGDFNSGVYLGNDVAEGLWRSMGSSCDNIWGFQAEVDSYLEKNYPTDTNDWRVNSCHEGMAAGAQQVVDKYEKQCLEESPDECYDLGIAAAQKIAYDYCPFNGASATSSTNYKQSCREVAYGVCKGAIYSQVQENAKTSSEDCSMTTSQLQQEQAKCEDQVNSMTGGAVYEMSRFIRKG